MDLKFTPRIINEIEQESKRPIIEIMGEFSMKNIVLLVKRGLGINEEEAFTQIEKYFEAGGDMVELHLTIMERMQVAGFLPRALNLTDTRAKMQQQIV